MKLSAAQKSVLGRLQAGEFLHFMSGLNPRYFWHDAISDRAPQWATVQALLDAGLAVKKDEEWRGWKVIATPPASLPPAGK